MQVEYSAIEVPGEANPLTEGILRHILRSASSSDPTQIQTGTKQLQQWEKSAGFYPLLQVPFQAHLSFAKTTNISPDYLHRQVASPRSSLPRYYTDQEWN
jgi:hypothetical protein